MYGTPGINLLVADNVGTWVKHDGSSAAYETANSWPFMLNNADKWPLHLNEIVKVCRDEQNNDIAPTTYPDIEVRARYVYPFELTSASQTDVQAAPGRQAKVLADAQDGKSYHYVKGSWATVRFSSSGGDLTGVRDLVSDGTTAGGPEEYYNLQGVRVSGEGLLPGVYLRRRGGKCDKIVIR